MCIGEAHTAGQAEPTEKYVSNKEDGLRLRLRERSLDFSSDSTLLWPVRMLVAIELVQTIVAEDGWR